MARKSPPAISSLPSCCTLIPYSATIKPLCCWIGTAEQLFTTRNTSQGRAFTQPSRMPLVVVTTVNREAPRPLQAGLVASRSYLRLRVITEPHWRTDSQTHRRLCRRWFSPVCVRASQRHEGSNIEDYLALWYRTAQWGRKSRPAQLLPINRWHHRPTRTSSGIRSAPHPHSHGVGGPGRRDMMETRRRTIRVPAGVAPENGLLSALLSARSASHSSVVVLMQRPTNNPTERGKGHHVHTMLKGTDDYTTSNSA